MSASPPEALAVVGLAFRLPSGVEDELSFWELLSSGQNLMTPWPENRLNLNGFTDRGTRRPNTLYAHGGHFVDSDPAAFDAPFFSITAKEAAAMDPAHRMSLETAYHAFENAGMPVEKLSGSRTAVLAALSTDDYNRFMCKDADQAPRMAATGIPPSMLAGRISWYFNLKGPSLLVDTACSSSMVAIDMACQYIRSGYASTALVLGVNLMLGPESSVLLSNMNFLSPDSVCHSFDHRANGYARGEGIIALVIKAVPDALQDGDMIRAIIRGSMTNQDGRTPGLTQPSAEAQEQMIREVYQKTGLGFESTRYVEAHGTGTAVGDPIEMKAIGRVFRTYRSDDEPLYVGSIKSNVGHLEGASGLAGVAKTILAVEKGFIPPVALFEKYNPAIDVDFYHTKVPLKLLKWPSDGLRRASVNSFGYGGTNSHLILDDACHFLHERDLNGNHVCNRVGPPSPLSENANTQENSVANAEPYLLVWSAADESALNRMIKIHDSYRRTQVAEGRIDLKRLALTLSSRRTHLAYRTYTVIDSTVVLGENGLENLTAKPIKATKGNGVAFIFTGQGAQYADMAFDLLEYSEFKESMLEAARAFESVGCKWSLLDAIRDKNTIDRPERSQPLCTAVQISLVRLLRSFGISPAAVLGHSSGEIAAAYTRGALTLDSACKVAYYRGQVAGELKANAVRPGAMLAVNLSETQIYEMLKIHKQKLVGSVHIACINSPANCTVSGDEGAIDQLVHLLKEQHIVARKLRTGVAYHSPMITAIAAQYKELLGVLDSGRIDSAIPMISSVTGAAVKALDTSQAQYWVDNLISPVRFSDAVENLMNEKSNVGLIEEDAITDVIEIGPHGALRVPLTDTVRLLCQQHVRYHSALNKTMSPSRTILELLGQLYCNGYKVDISAGNRTISPPAEPAPFLVDCPRYPFDTSRKYWSESRLSRDYRMRQAPPHDLLGVRSHDWNPLEPRWRKFWRLEEVPWLEHHVVNNMILLPGAAMLLMAVEAVRELAPVGRLVSGYTVKEAEFLSPVSIQPDSPAETILHLRPLQKSYEKETVWSEIEMFVYSHERWSKCFKAMVLIQYDEKESEVDGGVEKQSWYENIERRYAQSQVDCVDTIDSETLYDSFKEAGISFGKSFQLLEDIRWDHVSTCTSRIDLTNVEDGDWLVHPAVLDAAIHSSLVQGSAGLSDRSTTWVPRKVRDVWFSATAGQNTSSVKIMTNARKNPGGAGSNLTTCILPATNGPPLVVLGNALLLPVAQLDSAKTAAPRALLYRVAWEPQLSQLDPSQLRQICKADEILEDDNGMVAFYSKLERTLDQVIRHALEQLNTTDLQHAPGHVHKLITWMEQHRAQPSDSHGNHYTESCQIEGALKELAKERPKWGLFEHVGMNILPIIRGETDPLELLLSSGYAATLYEEIFDRNCDHRLTNFLKLASHENPGLRILEVGAGTGGMTNKVLAAFQQLEQCSGSDTFAEYTYTDISAAFFESARERYEPMFPGRIQFRTLDLENEPLKQGFELGAYDLVIAGSVLHATSNLARTLQNLRKVMRTAAHLVFLEVLAPYSIAANLGFGVLPGWWLSVEQWRANGPTITEGKWDELLLQNGFSGNDAVFKDYREAECHLSGIIISKAVPEKQEHMNGHTPGRTLYLLVDDQSERQTTLAHFINNEILRSTSFHQTEVLPLDTINDVDIPSSDVAVVITDIDVPILSRLTDHRLKTLKDVIKRIRNLLWVSVSPLDQEGRSTNPLCNLATGWLRSMRSEALDRHIVTLSIESSDREVAAYATDVLRVLEASFESDIHSAELEYIARNGVLRTGRLLEEIELNHSIKALTVPTPEPGPWKSGPPLKLAINTRGMLDTLEFIEDKECQRDLGADEVEIEAKAWGLSFRDIFVSLGRLDGNEFGYDCAGLVTRAGANADFRPGDRVVLHCPGCLRRYTRVNSQAVIKIPDALSFEAAASIINPGVTAYYSLIKVANLQRGEKILIHSASGATGQMAIMIAQMVGAEIFATVGFDSKRKLLIDQFGLRPDRIFYSRDTTFAQGIKRVTDGYGVDVVLNSLSGDRLRASWECVAPFGRFIEIGKADIVENSSLPMSQFSGNIGFFAVDLHHVGVANPQLANRLVKETFELVIQGRIEHPRPLQLYQLSEVEQAFRFMQSGKNTGRIVLTVSDDDIVQKRLLSRSDWGLDQNASYLIAGGFGGIGRAILRWLADKGARHLIVPSRSGPVSPAAAKTLAELRERGISVASPLCDASSESQLAAALKDCGERMPPIRGCINAAMALQDAVFDNMSYNQWNTTVQSKAYTSWNLHTLLPPNLDFFVQLSSLAGVYGSPAQSNYAAGCAFQDSLAYYRTERGQKAISFDVGWMRTIGIIAETETYQRYRKNTADMGQIEEHEFLALLSIFCNPSLPLLRPEESQLLIGVVTPRDLMAKGQVVTPLARRPLFAGFSRLSGTGHSDGTNVSVDNGALFKQAATAKERSDIVVRALSSKLARALSISPEEIDPSSRLSNCGVDSLMAVELRNWLGMDFLAEVAVFEIMDGIPISAIGPLVVERSEYSREKDVE